MVVNLICTLLLTELCKTRYSNLMVINQTVKYTKTTNAHTSEDALNAIFAALADPTRRSILLRLRSGDATVNELAAPYAMSLPAISKHLKVLEAAGLITRARNAQWRPCHLEAETLKGATEWLEAYRELWEGSLDNLAVYLQKIQATSTTKEQ